MSRLILLNKPYDVLCQFTDSAGRATLAQFIDQKDVYAAGRLDADSEGLVVLTDDGRLQHRISHPALKLPKTYLVQVEGEPNAEALALFSAGIVLNDGPCLPAQAKRVAEPDWLWPRSTPIRMRLHQPTSWLQVILSEGRNRQLRRMTAAIGHPTLRLIRIAVGDWQLGALQPGQWREETVHLPAVTTHKPAQTRAAKASRPARKRGRRL